VCNHPFVSFATDVFGPVLVRAPARFLFTVAKGVLPGVGRSLNRFKEIPD
jgi:hypothetical protein